MRAYSLLGPVESYHLRRALPESWVVREVDLQTILDELGRRAGGALLLNPADLHAGAFDELVRACSRAAAKIVLCHRDAFGLGAKVLIDAVRRADVEIVAGSVTDAAAYLEGIIALREQSIPMQVLRAIGPRLLRLPARAADVSVRLFAFGPLLRSPAAMFRLSSCHQTTLGRCYHAVGLCSPRNLLAWARTARACHFALTGTLNVVVVATACGGTARRLDNCLRVRLGVSYGKLCEHGVLPDTVARLVNGIACPEAT